MTEQQLDLSHIAEALRTHAVAIDSIHADPANARTHSARNIDVIKGSLQRFGQRTPLVVQQEGMIVRKGNGTLAAALALGWTHIAAIVVDESSVEAVAYAIADNRSGDPEVGSVFDLEAIASLTEELAHHGHSVIGFSDEELLEISEGLEAANAGEWESALGAIPSGEQSPFRQMTFTVSHAQHESISTALAQAIEAGPFDGSDNENRNGNALARIAEAYLHG